MEESYVVFAEEDGIISSKQNRLIMLLCAGLGITTLSELQCRKRNVADIMNDAWKDLVDNNVITMVKADDNDGYNTSRYHKNNEYVGCYYLDLSGEEKNTVCIVKLTKEVKECPVTGKLIDTTFCGYSPLLCGELNEKLIERYKCSSENIKMPIRPKDNDEVDNWANSNPEIEILKTKGLWSDRHKYSYKKQPTYIAA